MSPRGYSAQARRDAIDEAARAAQLRRRVIGGLACFALIVVLLTAIPMVISTIRSKGSPSMPQGNYPHIPVTVVEGQPLRLATATPQHTVQLFEDPRCSHCQTLEAKHGATLAAAVGEGKAAVELIPLHFVDPTMSPKLNNALACAASAGVGLGYHAGIYANPQLEWNDAQLAELYSLAGGGDSSAFSSCVAQNRYAGWERSMTEFAAARNITETPTLLIDGDRIDWSSMNAQTLAGKLQ